MKNKILPLLIVILLLTAFPLAAAAANWQGQGLSDKEYDKALAKASADDNQPVIPSGYSYHGDSFTDKNGKTIYYISQPVGDFGVARGHWIDQQGKPVTENKEAEAIKPSTDEVLTEGTTAALEKTANSIIYDVNKDSTDLPAFYDTRKLGYVTPVKNQIGGTCWAMASIAAIESNAIKQGYADNNIDLNEYFSVWNSLNGYDNSPEAANNSLNDGKKASDLYYMINDGGSPVDLEYSLLNFSGAVKESTISTPGTTIADINSSMLATLNIGNKYSRDITVEDIIQIGSKESSIKKALMEYGGLYLDFSYSTSAVAEIVRNGENYTTYYTGSSNPEGFHAVELIGWDDDFPKEYFKQTNQPNKDGAWLCKNSHGSNWGNMGGYFWLSYDDSTIKLIYAFKVADPKAFDTVFMYDGLSYSSYVSGATKAANIFTADKNTTLTKFSIGNPIEFNYTISIYKLGNQDSSPVGGKKIYTESGRTSGEKWTDLKQGVEIKEGDRFSVVIEGLNDCYVEGKSDDKKKYSSNLGESFYYKNGSWYDSAAQTNSNNVKLYNNVCIRVVGSVIEETPPPEEHNYSGEYRSNNNGTHCQKCISCDSYGAAEICTTKLTESKVGKDCQTEGTNTYVCSKCGYTLQKLNGKYGEHQYVDNRCTICGEAKSSGLFQNLVSFISSFFKSFISILQSLLGLFS